MVKIKRVYEKVDKSDGIRILVDRFWPRGLNKGETKVDYWIKEIAPSNSIRKWFAHKEERWEEFKNRYFEELKSKEELIDQLRRLAEKAPITLLFAAKNNAKNNAVVLEEFIKKKNEK